MGILQQLLNYIDRTIQDQQFNTFTMALRTCSTGR